MRAAAAPSGAPQAGGGALTLPAAAAAVVVAPGPVSVAAAAVVVAPGPVPVAAASVVVVVVVPGPVPVVVVPVPVVVVVPVPGPDPVPVPVPVVVVVVVVVWLLGDLAGASEHSGAQPWAMIGACPTRSHSVAPWWCAPALRPQDHGSGVRGWWLPRSTQPSPTSSTGPGASVVQWWWSCRPGSASTTPRFHLTTR